MVMRRWFAGGLVLFALVGVLLLFSARPAQAALVLVGTRAGLGGNDFYDWGGLGPALTVVADPFVLASNGGTRMLTGNNPSGVFERRDQNTGWNGNFAPGDKLLWTQDTVGPMELSFDAPVMGAGAQIQRDLFGAFRAKIEAFDAGNVSLGSFTVPGDSNPNADNSAIFLGVLSDALDIAKIVYSVDGTTQDFAINRLDIVVQQVPEPASASLVILGLLALIGSARHKRVQLAQC